MPLFSQIIAQFAWLGAACRTSPNPDQTCFTVAHIESTSNHPDNIKGFNIDFAFDFGPPPLSSSCWYSFCRYASIAHGFPIAARRQGEDGLELGLGLMATLAGADYVTSYKGKSLLKGFASMLIPVAQKGQSILWHFAHDREGHFLPYTALDAFECASSLSLEPLSGNRHFVGWVPAAEHHFGKSVQSAKHPCHIQLDRPDRCWLGSCSQM